MTDDPPLLVRLAPRYRDFAQYKNGSKDVRVVTAVEVSPDAASVIATTRDGGVTRWDVRDPVPWTLDALRALRDDRGFLLD